MTKSKIAAALSLLAARPTRFVDTVGNTVGPEDSRDGGLWFPIQQVGINRRGYVHFNDLLSEEGMAVADEIAFEVYDDEE